jgi:hypothetical protein
MEQRMSVNPQTERHRLKGDMRLLDSCLGRLEDDHERGQDRVTVDVARYFRSYVEGLVPGMLISDALELVFAEQEKRLYRSQTGLATIPIGASRPSVELLEALPVPVGHRLSGIEGRTADSLRRPPLVPESGPPLNAAQALELTQRIKTGVHQMSVLLLEAHDRRAWSALGYKSWSQYVRVELGLSRSRSYELLDHGRVLATLESAAGLSGLPDISPFAAQQIKPHLNRLSDEIRSRSVGLTELQAHQLVIEVIQEQRTARQKAHGEVTEDGTSRHPLLRVSPPSALDVDDLLSAIERLASLPAPAIVAALIPDDQANRLTDVQAAARWLCEFVDAWSDTNIRRSSAR